MRWPKPSSFRSVDPRWLGLSVLVALMGCGSPPGVGRHATPPPSSIRLRDVATEAGLVFRWGHNGRTPLTNLETFGCGCAFVDFDNDGWQDILLVGEPRCGLFRNLGNGKFADITTAVGLDRFQAPWKGCAIGDLNGDGWSDLVITGYHRTLVLRNEKGERVIDITRSSGIENHGWGGSAGFSDLDRDGDLDLYVCNYLVHGPNDRKYCELSNGIKSGCPPSIYVGDRGRLFRNDGGRFKDISRESGVLEAEGKALVVGFCDYDLDGWTDFYVGNDGTPADLFRNQGRMRFENRGIAAGIGLNASNAALAAMGIDWGDFDRDGKPDAIVTAFSNESFALFRNQDLGFADVGAETGIAGPTLKPLGFGTRFVDLDNDGWLDVVFACGHVYDNTDQIDPETAYKQPLMVFRNVEGQFRNVSSQLLGAAGRPIVGRGLATGDYDRDGRVDLLVVDYEGSPLLLRNETVTQNHWISIQVAGPPGNPRGYDCKVEVAEAHGARHFQLTPVASYLSSSEPVVHVGLGTEPRVGSIRVTSPDERQVDVPNPQLDRSIIVGFPASAQLGRNR